MSEVIKREVNGITLLHVLRDGEPKCPKCGQGLESEGGVMREGSPLTDRIKNAAAQDDGFRSRAEESTAGDGPAFAALVIYSY